MARTVEVDPQLTAVIRAASGNPAAFALFVSAIALAFNGWQIRNAIRALGITQTVAHSNTLIHFTSRFFDMLSEVEWERTEKLMENGSWAQKYWGLLTTEFYFFQNGMIPEFKFALWMVEFAFLYRGEQGKTIRHHHVEHMRQYTAFYRDMIDFFRELHRLANDCDDHAMRAEEIAQLVQSYAPRSPVIAFNRPRLPRLQG